MREERPGVVVAAVRGLAVFVVQYSIFNYHLVDRCHRLHLRESLRPQCTVREA